MSRSRSCSQPSRTIRIALRGSAAKRKSSPLSIIRTLRAFTAWKCCAHSDQAKFIERIRRPTFGKLEIDITLEDPKAYTKPFTVRVNQQISADDEIIEFICNENQQFRRRVKIE